MNKYIKKHIKSNRFNSLPEAMLKELKAARLAHHWSQQALGDRVGLPQMHISRIETGKLVPRFNTLLDIVRTLDYDLLLVPRSLVPTTQAIIRDQDQGTEEHSLYADNETREERGL